MTVSDSDIIAAGYALPEGTDMISDGDDAISKNARAAYTQIRDTSYYRGQIPAGTDIDAMRGRQWPGVWDTPPATNADLATLTGTWPPVEGANGGPVQCIMEVGGQLSLLKDMGYQRMNVLPAFQYGPQVWERFNTEYNTTGPAAWSPWVRLDSPDVSKDVETIAGRVTALEATGAGSDIGATHALLVQQHAAARGGTIGTGGLAAVSIRWDHYPDAPIAAGIPDLHRDRGIPIGWAHYSGQLGKGGHQTPWATIQSYALNYGFEAFAHSQTHADVSDEADLAREIVTARAEMEAALPSSRIDGWVVPGVGGTNYGGHTYTNSIDDWYGTAAGRLILATYATSSGHMDSHAAWWHPQNGLGEIGQAHMPIEKRTAAEVITAIEKAQTTGTKINLMLHPWLIGDPAGISTADYTAVLDYLATERDAGRLLITSLSGWYLTDEKHAHRDDLARGYSTAHPGATGTVTETIPLSERGYARGSVRETVLTATAVDGPATVTLARNGVTLGTLTLAAGETGTLRRCTYVSTHVSRSAETIDLTITGTADLAAVQLLAI